VLIVSSLCGTLTARFMKLLVFSLKARVNPAVAEAFAALRAAEFCRNWGLDKISIDPDKIGV